MYIKTENGWKPINTTLTDISKDGDSSTSSRHVMGYIARSFNGRYVELASRNIHEQKPLRKHRYVFTRKTRQHRDKLNGK